MKRLCRTWRRRRLIEPNIGRNTSGQFPNISSGFGCSCEENRSIFHKIPSNEQKICKNPLERKKKNIPQFFTAIVNTISLNYSRIFYLMKSLYIISVHFNSSHPSIPVKINNKFALERRMNYCM